ncbi:MAG: glutamate racemase [Hyphomonadaceae bacterium]|nr:glutamate racemase [Clostridia bacterium]
MDDRAIGVFDSGLGGLTAVKQLMAQLPHERIVYFGDTGRVPYGTRSVETVIKYVMQDIRFLMQFDLKMIVVACGTASAIALDTAKASFDLPIIGVVEWAAKQAVHVNRNGKIGVIGTQGTIASDAYARNIKAVEPKRQVLSIACPLFVPLVENGYLDHAATAMIVAEYLQPLKDARVDTLILGCTHYPLLKKVIAQFMGDDVHLIDPGVAIATHVHTILQQQDMLSVTNISPTFRYFVSDSVENFARLGSVFLQRPILELVEKVDIERF